MSAHQPIILCELSEETKTLIDDYVKNAERVCASDWNPWNERG